jgi:hypothetical protein
MALRVLDGNQTATTLSSVVTGGEHIVAHSVVSLGANAIANIASAVSGSVVSISNFPASQTIAGTVTANSNFASLVQYTGEGYPTHAVQLGFSDVENNFFRVNSEYGLPVQIVNSNLNVSTANPLPISGAVTVGNSVTIGSLPAISGTVTANNPSGALTTRFGSVTTANTAQLTSAVTNTSRKYLLVQNIATSTVTIGIGFAPTTTQGIQLTAGAGLTFDAFTPTGAIYWLSSVTGSNFSILEG